MDDDSPGKKLLIAALGVVGLGAVASAIFIPKIGLWIALLIIVLALLLFGGFYLWQRWRARRQSGELTSGLQSQSSAVPKSVSDPEQRANLDALRQKWQDGLKEFKSRGKDIYTLPWFVIIGESGSGKTEAIRHSAIDFPAGMNPELQGSGGTINMDWWFTNRGIIIDTAGKMIIPDEGGEDRRAEWKPRRDWVEFLRLLRKSRSACPINGLLMVLSTESLIKDSADKIASKASRLAQHLDLIQRELDVRFPVYLLVTKCDLLEGFREFSDGITDPLLQHQIFGWSNPDPLDAPFRPDLVEQFLATVAERVRRRRLALLREGVGGRPGDSRVFFGSGYQLGRSPAPPRRLDEVDSMFALPHSIMQQAPRLQRYLETIFVAGVWSAKPVFLRGIYFTSSMREGAALDEAMALASGLSLDQVPERRVWESRAFFLRDLFHDKIFREYGLVTRATNTLKLLRQRQLAIFGTAAVLLVLLLAFSWTSYRGLRAGVLKEAKYWQAATNGWDHGIWTNGAIVSLAPPYQYRGANPMLETNILGYQEQLVRIIREGLPVGWVFKPIARFSQVKDRPVAQRIILEGGVLRPLVEQTWAKMARSDKPATNTVAAYKGALLALIRLEADGIRHPAIETNAAESYLRDFLAYLTDTNQTPDTNLVNILVWTYSAPQTSGNGGTWPPPGLHGAPLAGMAITNGLDKFHLASLDAQEVVTRRLDQLATLASNLVAYQANEMAWLTNRTLQSASDQDACWVILALEPRKAQVDAALAANGLTGQVTNIDLRFDDFQRTMSNSSQAAISVPVGGIIGNLPPASQVSGIFKQVTELIKGFAQEAANVVEDKRKDFRTRIPSFNTDYLALSSSDLPIYQERWRLYTNACALASRIVTPTEADIGSGWVNYKKASAEAGKFQDDLAKYQSSLSNQVKQACGNIAARAVAQLQNGYVAAYVQLASQKLSSLAVPPQWNAAAVTEAGDWVGKIENDLKNSAELGDQEKALDGLRSRLPTDKRNILAALAQSAETDAQRFPLCLRAGPAGAMSADELSRFRDLLKTLSTQADAPVWKSAGPEPIQRIRDDCNHYLDILNSLVTPDGNFAEWRISFRDLQGEERRDNRSVLMTYRQVALSVGDKNGTDFHDPLDSGPLVGVKGTANSPIKIELYDFLDKQQRKATPRVVSFADWGFPHLASSATREGASWKVKIPLNAGEAAGSAIFMVESATHQPLPDPQEWLRLCH